MLGRDPLRNLKIFARPPEHYSSYGKTEQTASGDSQNHMAAVTLDQQVRVKLTNREHWPKLLIAVSPDNLTCVRIHRNADLAAIRLPDQEFDVSSGFCGNTNSSIGLRGNDCRMACVICVSFKDVPCG